MNLKPHYKQMIQTEPGVATTRMLMSEEVMADDGYEPLIDYESNQNHIEGQVKNLDRSAVAGYILCPATFTDESQGRKNEPIGWTINKIDDVMIRCLTPQIINELLNNKEWRDEVLTTLNNKLLVQSI